MRIQCSGCNATVDLYEGALDECPVCDTTHNFRTTEHNIRKPRSNRSELERLNRAELDRIESLIYQ